MLHTFQLDILKSLMMYTIASMHNSHFCKSPMFLNDPMLIHFRMCLRVHLQCLFELRHCIKTPICISLSLEPIVRPISSRTVYYHRYEWDSKRKGMAESKIMKSLCRWVGELVYCMHMINRSHILNLKCCS